MSADPAALRQVLWVGGPKPSGFDVVRSLLLSLGFEVYDHWHNESAKMKQSKIPKAVDLVIINTERVTHSIQAQVKAFAAAASPPVPIVYSTHRSIALKEDLRKQAGFLLPPVSTPPAPLAELVPVMPATMERLQEFLAPELLGGDTVLARDLLTQASRAAPDPAEVDRALKTMYIGAHYSVTHFGAYTKGTMIMLMLAAVGYLQRVPPFSGFLFELTPAGSKVAAALRVKDELAALGLKEQPTPVPAPPSPVQPEISPPPPVEAKPEPPKPEPPVTATVTELTKPREAAKPKSNVQVAIQMLREACAKEQPDFATMTIDFRTTKVQVTREIREELEM